jgi:hypothetical protein
MIKGADAAYKMLYNFNLIETMNSLQYNFIISSRLFHFEEAISIAL